jgi:hypothetical protein
VADTRPQLSLASLVDLKNDVIIHSKDQGNNCYYTSIALLAFKKSNNDRIMNSDTINHMTLCPKDFVNTMKPRWTSITNANMVEYPVIGVRIMHISPFISLTNTLLVLSLSNKLLSIGQVTEELNRIVLMYPIFFPRYYHEEDH